MADSTGDEVGGRRAIVQVLDSLGDDGGGLTRAVFDRFRVVADGRRAILVTVAFEPNVEMLFEELKSSGVLPPHTELLNFHEDLRDRDRAVQEKILFDHRNWAHNPSFQSVQDGSGSRNIQRYFSAGAFVGLVCRTADGELRYVERHENDRPWLLIYRDTAWAGESIGRRDYFDGEGIVRFRTYIGLDERPYISTWVNAAGYEYRTVEQTCGEPTLHRDMRKLNSLWLAEKLDEYGPAVVFTDQPRASFALSINSPRVFHVTSIHTTHFKNNVDKSDGMKQWMKNYIASRDNVGFFVFFTDAQRRDFVEDTSCLPQQAIVVPHAAPLDAGTAVQRVVSRAEQLFVTVSRLADDKQIDHAIRAFAKVHSVFPRARYKIYGIGPASESLRKLISEYKLEGVVTLEGQTNDPLSQFAAADCSVLTSRYEGFGLVLTESFACGTPVISYDVIYGPREVVLHGHNGLLVPEADIDELATSMVAYLGDSELRSSLRAGAASSAGHYDTATWKHGWISAVSAAERVITE